MIEDGRYLRVGHSRRGADDAFDDFEAFDAAGGIELHDATEDETVFLRAQAADAGRKLLRQHGDGAIGKVDAVAAQAGFEIERGVELNVFGHVGDVDLEFVSAAVGAIGTRTASSKSLAVSPSIVTMARARKSVLPAAASGSRWATDRASKRTFSGKMRGNWCLRIIISTSTPKSSGEPRISTTRPMGGRVGVGQLVISTSTMRPSCPPGLWVLE